MQCRSYDYSAFLNKEASGKFVPTPFTLSPLCPLCQCKNEICGPTWLDKIHDKDFCQSVLLNAKSSDLPFLGTRDRIEGFTSIIYEVFFFALF